MFSKMNRWQENCVLIHVWVLDFVQHERKLETNLDPYIIQYIGLKLERSWRHVMACYGMLWHVMACYGMLWHVMALSLREDEGQLWWNSGSIISRLECDPLECAMHRQHQDVPLSRWRLHAPCRLHWPLQVRDVIKWHRKFISMFKW